MSAMSTEDEVIMWLIIGSAIGVVSILAMCCMCSTAGPERSGGSYPHYGSSKLGPKEDWGQYTNEEPSNEANINHGRPSSYVNEPEKEKSGKWSNPYYYTQN